tara:strand:+ start:190 stop:336 length:147 start_codon:yes stop_codon:yes gene_type:complete
VVADRLKLPIQKVLDMPLSHFNLWIAYLKKEQDEYNKQSSLVEARKYK